MDESTSHRNAQEIMERWGISFPPTKAKGIGGGRHWTYTQCQFIELHMAVVSLSVKERKHLAAAYDVALSSIASNAFKLIKPRGRPLADPVARARQLKEAASKNIETIRRAREFAAEVARARIDARFGLQLVETERLASISVEELANEIASESDAKAA